MGTENTDLPPAGAGNGPAVLRTGAPTGGLFGDVPDVGGHAGLFKDVPEVNRPKGLLGTVDDVVRSLASGATFGFADELAAKADELTGRGGTYEQNLAREHARDAAIPGAVRIPGEIGGAVAGTIAAAPVAAPLAAATGVGKLGALARSILGGTGVGALFGAGNASSGDRLRGAGEGAVIGGVLGGVSYPTTQVLGAVGRGVLNTLSPRSQAAADLSRAIVRDQTTPAQLATDLAAARNVRPGATLADVGGENVQGLVERIAQTPGAGRTIIVPALTERQGMQLVRLSSDLGELTASPGNFANARKTAFEAIKETMDQRAQAARPLYRKAVDEFDASSVPEIVDAFRNEVSGGHGKAILQSAEFKKNLQTEFGIEDWTKAPLMVVVDAWKKAADDIVGEAVRQGRNNTARIVGNMRDHVIGVVDTHNPAYRAARDAWSGPSQYIDAVEAGTKFMNAGADEVRAKLASLTAAEREGYVTGALSGILRKMGNDPAKMADFTKYLRSSQMRDKIEALMPTPEAAQAWRQRLDFEIQASRMTARALGNSRTAVRQAEQGDAEGLAGDMILAAFNGAPPISAMYKLLSHVPQKMRDTVYSRSDSILANILTNPADLSAKDMASLLAAAQRKARPPSLLQATAPANAATAAIEGQ